MTIKRKQYVTSRNLGQYRDTPNIFWRAFSKQYGAMFMKPVDLIEKESLDNWFAMTEDTIESLTDFVESPNQDSPQLLVLSGVTGSGKTTTVRVLFERLEKEWPKELVYLYVDASLTSDTAKDLERDLDSQIYARLKEDIGDAHFSGSASPDDESDSANKRRLNQLIQEGNQVVLVWDNIDQCPYHIQDRCIRLAHHKLNWIKQQKIIIPIREYTLSLVAKELPIVSFDDVEIVRHYPPSISDVIRIRSGLPRRAMDQLAGKRESIDADRGITITIADGTGFLSKVVDDLCKPYIAEALRDLSNNDVRTQLRMVRYVFASSYLTREVILDALRAYSEGQRGYTMIPIHRFLGGIITGSRGKPYRVFSFHDSLVINIFNAGGRKGWYNTLNRHHVARIIAESELGVDTEEIIEDLEKLGHPRPCTMRTIELFLKCGLIWSAQGCARDYPEMINLVMPTFALEYYLDSLINRLIYLQHMGLATPLEESFRRNLMVCPVDEHYATFAYRVNPAAQLLRQIQADSIAEIQYAKQSLGGRQIIEEYDFGDLPASIAKNVLRELASIRTSGLQTMGIPEGTWKNITAPFREVASRTLSI